MLSSLPKSHPGLVFFFVTCLTLKAFEFPTLTYFYLNRSAAGEDELPNMHSETRPEFLPGEYWQANIGTCQQVGLSTPRILAERLEGWYYCHSGGGREGRMFGTCRFEISFRYPRGNVKYAMLNKPGLGGALHSDVSFKRHQHNRHLKPGDLTSTAWE